VINPPLYAPVPAAVVLTSIVTKVGGVPGVLEVPLVHPVIVKKTANRQATKKKDLVKVLFMC
jgi:multisubunit Na+/H+ antiporter MnhC subunit